MSACRRLFWATLPVTFAVLLAAACGGSDGFQPGPPLEVEPQAPALPTDPMLDPDISVPEGFIAYEYASGLDLPTSLAFDSFGRLFVSELRGEIKLIEDEDGDGVGDTPRDFWSDPRERFILGIAVAPDGSIYASLKGTVVVLRDEDRDGRPEEEHVIIEGLPRRVHQNNGLAFGPDGKLYITNGSTCNLCREKDERSATVLRSDLDGGNVEVFARGLRNPYDLAFDRDGGLWATSNGHDFFEPADEGFTLLRDPPDELNYVVEGGHYGWPECAGREQETAADGCEGKVPPVVELEPHSSSDGLLYYNGENFPAEYAGDFFVAQYGSDRRSEAEAGREVIRVEIASSEGPERYSGSVSEFASGFSRPLDVTVDALGTMYVADFATGSIYRIVWAGE